MEQLYIQNESCEFVPLVMANLDVTEIESPPDDIGYADIQMTAQREFSCEFTLDGPSSRRMHRYLIVGWRTRHGPVRWRLRKRAQHMIVKSLADRLNRISGFASVAVILYLLGYKNSDMDFDNWVDSQDFYSDDAREELKRAYHNIPEQTRKAISNFLKRSESNDHS